MRPLAIVVEWTLGIWRWSLLTGIGFAWVETAFDPVPYSRLEIWIWFVLAAPLIGVAGGILVAFSHLLFGRATWKRDHSVVAGAVTAAGFVALTVRVSQHEVDWAVPVIATVALASLATVNLAATGMRYRYLEPLPEHRRIGRRSGIAAARATLGWTMLLATVTWAVRTVPGVPDVPTGNWVTAALVAGTIVYFTVSSGVAVAHRDGTETDTAVMLTFALLVIAGVLMGASGPLWTLPAGTAGVIGVVASAVAAGRAMPSIPFLDTGDAVPRTRAGDAITATPDSPQQGTPT